MDISPLRISRKQKKLDKNRYVQSCMHVTIIHCSHSIKVSCLLANFSLKFREEFQLLLQTKYTSDLPADDNFYSVCFRLPNGHRLEKNFSTDSINEVSCM